MSRTKASVPSMEVTENIVHMKLDKETRGAVRYAEIDARGSKISTDAENVVLATVYVRKTALKRWLGDDSIPKSLTVRLTADAEA